MVTFQILPFSTSMSIWERLIQRNCSIYSQPPSLSLSRHGPSRWTQQLWSCDGSCCIHQVPLNIEDFHSEHIIRCLDPEGSTGMSGILWICIHDYPCKNGGGFANVSYPWKFVSKTKTSKSPPKILRALALYIWIQVSHLQVSSWAKYHP